MTDAAAPGPLRIMLVDDHALVRVAVRQALSAPDVELVAEAASAEEALALAPQVRPDVLLVDIGLPGMDGVELVRELAPRLPETRIVMLTVSSAEHDLLAAMRYGAVGYLTKDVSPEALLRSVRSALRRRAGHAATDGRAAGPPPGGDLAPGRPPRARPTLPSARSPPARPRCCASSRRAGPIARSPRR